MTPRDPATPILTITMRSMPRISSLCTESLADSINTKDPAMREKATRASVGGRPGCLLGGEMYCMMYVSIRNKDAVQKKYPQVA